MPLITSSFGGVLTPAQIHALMNALVSGAPFGRLPDQGPYGHREAGVPHRRAQRLPWLEEMEEVPRLVLNDKALIVAVRKIMGGLPISTEMLSDATVNITAWVNGALADSLSRDLDLGLLGGSGGGHPAGILAQAEAVTGATLIAAAGAAIAAIGEAGGVANTIALSPTAYAAELTATDAKGRPIHPDGLDRTCPGSPSSRCPASTRRWPTTPADASWSWARTPPSPRMTTLAARRDAPARLGPRQRRGAGRPASCCGSWRSPGLPAPRGHARPRDRPPLGV